MDKLIRKVRIFK